MKVKNCDGCAYKKRKVWSHRHECRNYHDIGMSHAYAWCDKYMTRCSKVKGCEERK